MQNFRAIVDHIIDEAMEKGGRYVSLLFLPDSLSVNIYPIEDEEDNYND